MYPCVSLYSVYYDFMYGRPKQARPVCWLCAGAEIVCALPCEGLGNAAGEGEDSDSVDEAVQALASLALY